MFCVNHRPAAVADWWSIHQPTAAGGGGRRRAEQVGRHACQSPDRVRRVVHAGARSSGARKNGVQYATSRATVPSADWLGVRRDPHSSSARRPSDIEVTGAPAAKRLKQPSPTPAEQVP